MNHLTRDGIGVRCVSCNRPQETPIKTMIVAGTGATKGDEIDNCQHVLLTLLYIFLPTAMRAHKPQAVSDWLNTDSLGTISAFGYIDNLA